MLQLAEKTAEQREQKEDCLITEEELHQKAYEAAVESMVLLKNRDDILPLKPEDKILVVGEMAENPRYQVGGGSAAVLSYEVDKPLDYIRIVSPRADYANGYSDSESATEKEQRILLKEALEKAAKAEKIVIFAGLTASYESEGYDRSKLDLPEYQGRLIRLLSQCNKNIIVVLANGSAVTMPWLPRVKAVLENYLGGEAVGRAIADLYTD